MEETQSVWKIQKHYYKLLKDDSSIFIYFLIYGFEKKGVGGERGREKHRLVAPHMHAFIG